MIDDRFLVHILDNVPVPVAYLDRDLVYRYCNAEAARRMGRSVEEVVGRPLREALPDNPTVWEIVERVRETGEPLEAVIHFARADRPELGERSYRMSYRAERDEAGQIIGVLAKGKEVTEEQRAERALQESETRFRSLYTAMEEGLALHQVVYDADGQPVDYVLLEINPAYEKITGLSREQAVGQRASVVYGTGEPPYLDIYAPVAASGKATSFETYFPPMEKYFSISVFSPEPGRFATVFSDITERRETEAERRRLLEESQRRTAELEAVISSIASGVVLYDSAGQIVRMNDAAQEMLGYSDRERGLSIEERAQLFQVRLGEDDLPGEPDEMPAARALRGETVRNQLLVLQRGTEAPRWVLASAAPVRTPTGQVLGIVSTFSDVTALHEVQQQVQETNVILEERTEELQQKTEELEVQEEELRCQAEELLQQNRDLEKITRELEAERANLATILDNAPEPILVSDKDGQVVRVNPAAQALYGWPRKGKAPSGFGPKRYRPDHTPLLSDELPLVRSARYGETHQDFEMAARSPDGQWHDLLINSVPLRDGQGNITGAVTVQRDITERKRTEEALRKSEAKLRAIFEALVERIVFLNPQGEVEEMNESVQQRHDQTLQELRDPRRQIVRPDGTPFPAEEQPAIVALHTGKTVRDVEMGVPTSDGSLRWRLVNAQPVYDDLGRLLGAVASFFDITERKQAQERLRQALGEAEAGQRLLDALMEYIPEGITIADAEARLQRVSRYGQNLLGEPHAGMTAEEVVDEWAIYYPDGTPMEAEETPLVRAIHRGEVLEDFELVQVNSQGRRLPLLCNAGPIRDSTGRVTGGIVAWRDITELKLVEEERERLLAEAEEARRLSETHNRIDALLISSLDLDAVVQKVIVEAAQGLGMDTGRLDWREGDSWVVRQVYGLPPEQIGRRFSNEEDKISWLAMQRRDVLVVDDRQSDPRFAGRPGNEPGIHLSVSIPLLLRGQVVGVLNFTSRSPEARLSLVQLDFARKLSSSFSLALENSRLYEQARHDAETRAALLREVNHRVKNNLVAITGMLYAEEDRPEVKGQPAFQVVIHDLVRRIEALSVVHGMLSATQWAPLPVDELARQIAQNLFRAIPPGQLQLQIVPSTVHVSSDQAHALALVLNELLMNAAKYALDGEGTRHVTVKITAAEGKATLTLRDDGPGYPQDVLAQRRSGIGLYLARNLVQRNLRGKIELRNDGGAVAEVYFPLKEAVTEGASKGR